MVKTLNNANVTSCWKSYLKKPSDKIVIFGLLAYNFSSI